MKINRLLREFEKKYDYGIITEEEIIKIAQAYFLRYQDDTIIRDLANINRLTEYSLDYNDYEKEDINMIDPLMIDDNFFLIVVGLIKEKIQTRDF
jgi:hypothetical protein